MNEDDLASLVAAAAGGDKEAWDALVTRFNPLLWGISRAYRLDFSDACDAVQTTWLRLVENLDRIDDPSRLAGWLATTMRRECLLVWRRAKREQPVLGVYGLEQEPSDAAPLDATILLDERDAALWRIFTKLPDACRRLLRVLMASPPPSYAEAAAALDMPIGSIGPSRGRCLDKLKSLVLGDDLLGDGQP